MGVRMRGLSVATAFLVAAGSVALTGSPAASATAASATAASAMAATGAALPITSSGDIVVDGDHRRVFISDPSGGKVVVTDYAGRVVATVASLPGVQGLELSEDSETVYAAAARADAIVAIDTDTLKESARYPTGPGTRPTFPALTGDTLWFGYGAATEGDIGSVDVSDDDGDPTVTLNRAPGREWYSAPMLASAPGEPDVLVAGSVGLSPAEVVAYDVSGGTVKRQAYLWTSASNTEDIALSPDGDQVVVASGFPYHLQVYRTSDLAEDGAYTTGSYPNAVDIAPDGTVAGGVNSWYSPDVFTFRPGTATPIREYDFGRTSATIPTLQSAGLAWAPDRSRLFAVAGDRWAGAFTLEVLPAPTRPAP
ncbi:YncE family protein [Streptomyces sp. NPDC004838]